MSQQALANQKRKTAYAWAQFYEVNKAYFEKYVQNYTELNDKVGELPTHLVGEFQDLLKRLKIEIECPVCLEIISDLKITFCGHKYCKDCLETLKKSSGKCAICRKTLV